MTGSRVRLVIRFDKDSGFDSSATLPQEDAEKIATQYWDAVKRAYGSGKPPIKKPKVAP